MFEIEEAKGFNFEIEESFTPGAKIKVVGVGGAGGNAVNRMLTAGVKGVEFIVMNTDQQALARNMAPTKLQIGGELTGGKGAGAKPEVGRQAALESEKEIAEAIRGADMLFVAAGMGKGTGTGAAPVVVQIAKRLGILTIPVVTLPFSTEGESRMTVAKSGIESLKSHVDSVLVIPNDRILSIAGRIPLMEAFRQVDDTLRHAIQSITNVIALDGEMNTDFNDVKTIMSEEGGTYMGVGVGDGDGAAVRAAEQAMTNPYLENPSVRGVKGILVNISAKHRDRFAAEDLNQVLITVRAMGAPGANIIHGLGFNAEQDEELRVTVIATGFSDVAEVVAAEAKTKKQMETKLISVENVITANPDDLEIPTFLRLRLQQGLDGQAA